jgi:hypothetical protein
MKEDQLIFLISQPRSGSTLLQAILSNHPQIDTTSEHWLQLPFISLFKPKILNSNFDSELAYRAINNFNEKFDRHQAFKSDLKAFLFKQYEVLLTKNGNLVLDKTPRYYEIAEELFNTYPSARFIILKRNPVVVLKSIIDTWDKREMSTLIKENERDIFDAPFIIQSFLDKHHLDSNVISLKYENLISNPVGTIDSLFKWLNLDFHPSLLDYSQNHSFVGEFGDPIGVLKFKKLQKQLISSNTVQISIEKHHLKDLLNGYGHFLGSKFLEIYGFYPYFNSFAPTGAFKLFNQLRRYRTTNSLSQIARLLLFNLKMMFYIKNRPSHNTK